jgi:hypothetical protein
LFVIDVRFLTSRQLAAIGCAIRTHLLVDSALLIFQLSGFTAG